MSNVFHDYFKQTVLTIPDSFIDIRTGDKHTVPPKIKDEIAYHAENNTLAHLIFSALNDYLKKDAGSRQWGTNEVLAELMEIKRMLSDGAPQRVPPSTYQSHHAPTKEMDFQEIEDMLEAFGG